jgi:glycosyltransferase involved in cell wall biosynthesis
VNIFLENVNMSSNSGPNSFAKKLEPELQNLGCSFTALSDSNVALCFIESSNPNQISIPRALRLDGIYFNTSQNYKLQNRNIERTYHLSEGIIYQSNFNKRLIEKYFGESKESIIIHNGADIASISETVPMSTKGSGDIWCCAAHWRPHKRLLDNIRYFMEHKKEDDILIVAGAVADSEKINDPSIAYFGKLTQKQLYSVYRSAKYFIHLSWLDHCPNVVVDARAAGCHIICSNTGGTREIAGLNSTIIEEEEWDFKPINLYSPPKLNFQRKVKNNYDSCYNIAEVANLYKRFLEKLCQQ